MKLEFSVSLGLSMTPKVRFLKIKGKKVRGKPLILEIENPDKEDLLVILKEELLTDDLKEDKMDLYLLQTKEAEEEGKANIMGDVIPATRILKKKKLKITTGLEGPELSLTRKATHCLHLQGWLMLKVTILFMIKIKRRNTIRS